jgi:hypothetical protein
MLEGLTPPGQLRSCKVGQIASTLDDSDRKILLDAVASSDWPIKSLSRALQQRGIVISDTPLTNHRKQSCVCFQGA